jgi:hypothetical protein
MSAPAVQAARGTGGDHAEHLGAPLARRPQAPPRERARNLGKLDLQRREWLRRADRLEAAAHWLVVDRAPVCDRDREPVQVEQSDGNAHGTSFLASFLIRGRCRLSSAARARHVQRAHSLNDRRGEWRATRVDLAFAPRSAAATCHDAAPRRKAALNNAYYNHAVMLTVCFSV